MKIIRKSLLASIFRSLPCSLFDFLNSYFIIYFWNAKFCAKVDDSLQKIYVKFCYRNGDMRLYMYVYLYIFYNLSFISNMYKIEFQAILLLDMLVLNLTRTNKKKLILLHFYYRLLNSLLVVQFRCNSQMV